MAQMGDAALTRARLLEAALSEFADYGLAGARVDRLAARAGCNKQLIYEYFGSKEGLFDATIQSTSERLAVEVPFDPTDLAGHAVALYDFMVEHPEAARLVRWHALERPGVAGSAPWLVKRNRHLVGAIAEAQHAGLVADDLSARMLLVFVIALVQTNEDERLVNRGKPIPHAEKRKALRSAVQLLSHPSEQRPETIRSIDTTPQ